MEKAPWKKIDLLVALLIACLFAFFSFHSFSVFEKLGRVIYSIQMRMDMPSGSGPSVVSIVNIDDKSLKQLGPWPWPRQMLAEMISILRNNGAKMIVLDFLFGQKERNQGLREIRELQKEVAQRSGPLGKDPWLHNALAEAEKKLDNDSILDQAVKECGNIYLPVVGTYGNYESELALPDDSFLQKCSLKEKPSFSGLLPIKALTAPYPELSESCRGLGHTNLSPNKSSQGESHLLFLDYRSNTIMSLPFRLALDYLNKSPEDVIVPGKGIRLKNTLIPVVNGQILIKFRGVRRSFPYYSFVDILSVRKVPAVFDGKIVLIGYTAEDAPTVQTPVDPEMPQVELTANVINDLVNGRYLKRPGFMIYVEMLVVLFFSLFASFVLPRQGFINRMGITASLIFLLFIVGFVFFMIFDVWFKIIYACLALVTIFFEHSVRDVIITQRTLGITSKESIETNRMLGLSLQSQGLLDLAFEKFRKIPLDDAMKDVVYNLGLDYERKRMLNKAVAVYEYIANVDKNFRDLGARVPKLRSLVSPLSMAGQEARQDGKIVFSDDLGIKPTVGRYEILEELGQGAMGIVYKARDPKINRLLAIKTIRFSDEFETEKIREVKERFMREAEIAGKLAHPAIVAVYDVGEDYELTYMAMEYLEGESLLKFSRKGSLLPLRRALYVVAETALALDYAHKQGVIHRDVKPANIMLLKDGQIKVTDFGIAKAVSSSQTKSGIVLGTPNYMSPEQINGHEIDGRSDIFSLGVVFFELMTGQLPFHGKNLTNLFYQITQVKHTSPRQINPKVPKPVEQIIDKALAKNPAQRFPTGADFARYLKAMINKIDQVKARVREGAALH
jgi:CHASE2 domain-containing sensor protein/tRNA A-37 threonylcarbamoyl transferase component Bud32